MAKSTGTGKNGFTPLSAIGVALAAQNYNSLMPSSNNQVDLSALQKWLIKPNDKVIAEGIPETKRILEQAKNMGRIDPIEELQAEKAMMRKLQKQEEENRRRQELMAKVASSQTDPRAKSLMYSPYGSTDTSSMPLMQQSNQKMAKGIQETAEILKQAKNMGRINPIEELQAEKAIIRKLQKQEEENRRRQELLNKTTASYTGSGTMPRYTGNGSQTQVPFVNVSDEAIARGVQETVRILDQAKNMGHSNPIEELQAEKISMREFQKQREMAQRRQELLDKTSASYTRPGTMPPYAGNGSQTKAPFIINDETIANGTQNAKEILEQTKDRPITNIQPSDLWFPGVPSFKDYSVLPDDFNAYKAGGKALAVVGKVIDAVNIATAVKADLSDSDKRLGKKKTAAAVGGAAASAFFGYLGAAAISILAAGAAGALAGSILPGPGTIVGFIGGLVGGMIGAAAGEEFSDWIINQIDWDE